MFHFKNIISSIKKVQISILLTILLFNSFISFNQVKLDAKNDGISTSYKLRIANLNELIVTDLDKAEAEIDLFKKEVQNFEKTNIIIEVSLLEAEMYRSQGDYVHMKLAYYEALSWKNKSTHLYQNTLLEHLSALNEGIKGNKKNQEKKLLAVNKIAKNNNFYFIEAKSHFSLGKFYSNESNYKLAKFHLEKAKQIFNTRGYKNLEFETKVTQGISCFWEGKYNEALKWFQETKKYSFENNLLKSYANALLNLGEAHLFIEGNSDSAKYYFDLFLEQKNVADPRDIFHCYWNLEEYYNLKNNPILAYKYSKLMIQVDNQIKDKMIAQTNLEIDRVYKKLQNERKLTDEKNYQIKLKIIFGLCGLFLLLIIIIFIVIIYQKNKTNRLLFIYNKEILLQKNVVNITLKEKELLLKEIHHRVKNNLQIISSLLSLQSNNLENEPAKIAINECKERIQAIALIHQKLYLDTSFATINMNDYLNDLINQLFDSYNSADKTKISIKTNDIILNIDTVVPLGLIICELITNSFKYAFQNKTDGILKVEISKLNEKQFQLKIKDNGSGMKEGFDFLESQTLGVEIITALTDQLEGEISYKSNEDGTTIRVNFIEINS